MAKTAPHFGSGFFEFFRELAANNEREWFNARKQRYLDLVEPPMLRFIGDLGARLGKVSKRFVADPRRVGGSMFRIYRDTRFAKDKSPFKTWAAAHFPHEARGKDESVPGFYLHLEPGACYGGGGIYHPETEALKQIRDRLAGKPKEWEAVRRTKIPIEGDALKRPPQGYDREHPFIDDLKRKDIYSMARFSEREVCSPRFLDAYVAACARIAPLLQFLTRALGLPW